MAFLFWFFLGLLGLTLNKKKKRINLQKATGINFVFSLAFAFILIGAITFLFFGVKIWLSDYFLAKSQRVYAKTQELEPARQSLLKSVSFGPWFATSHLWLADNYTSDGLIKINQKEQATAQQLFNRAKSEVESALLKDKKNAALTEQAGAIYQSINNAAGPVTLAEAVAVYEKAIELDPHNAYLWLIFGNVYLSQAQNNQVALSNLTDNNSASYEELKKNLEENLKKSWEKLLKSTELKENYWEAEMLLAKVLELQDNLPKALERLQASLEKNPTNLTLLEEIGKMFLSDNKEEEAERYFQTILILSPNHANSRFWLATIYEKQGEKDKAIAELEKVLKTNPTSSLVIQKISQLKGE